MISKQVEERLKHLERSHEAHVEVGGYMLRADDAAVFPVDLVAQAVLHRSMSLIRGFCDAIRSENFLCAAPLVRLQLDNLLRFYALTLVDRPHEVATRILAGKPVRTQLDRSGRKMTDRYLARKLAEELPWVERVYQETSGYVHLSEKHILNTIISVDDAARTVEHGMTGSDLAVPDSLRLEAVDAMVEITKQLLGYVHSWARTKDIVGRSRPKPEGKN